MLNTGVDQVNVYMMPVEDIFSQRDLQFLTGTLKSQLVHMYHRT